MSLKAEYLGMIPEFQGETELLPRFLSICEKLVTKFYNTADPTDFQNEYLMSSILSKIKGEAAINIASSTISTFNDLRTALLAAYADKRDIYTLNIEMTEMKQDNETAFDFYNRIQQILNLQISYITTHCADPERNTLAQYCRFLALRVLLRGLKEPIGSLMRTKNPADLNSALNMLTNDFQIETALQKSHKLQYLQNKNSKFNLPSRSRTSQQPQNFSTPLNQNLYSNFQKRLPAIGHNNSDQNSLKPMSGVSHFVNKPSNSQKNPKVTPMSGVSTYITRPTFPNNSQKPPNFRFEELHNISETNEISEDIDQYGNPQETFDTIPTIEYPADSEDQYLDQPQFFQIEASETTYPTS